MPWSRVCGAPIRVSKNTAITVTYNAATAAATTADCILDNPGAKSHPWVYISDKGGLEPPSTTPCAGYTNAPA